jgi:hypothetical protein
MSPHVPDPAQQRFSVSEIPFSRYGSWLDISPVTGLHQHAADLHLVTHQTGLHAILSLVPHLGDQPVEATGKRTRSR